jgi:hypothetical protein
MLTLVSIENRDGSVEIDAIQCVDSRCKFKVSGAKKVKMGGVWT